MKTEIRILTSCFEMAKELLKVLLSLRLSLQVRSVNAEGRCLALALRQSFPKCLMVPG